MTKLLKASVSVAYLLCSIATVPAWSAPFELKVQKVVVDIDGMQVDNLFFPSGDKVLRFVQAPTWTMLNSANSISIKDSKVESGNMEVTFRGIFQSKDPKALESEIVADAIGDLYPEGNPDAKFELVELRNHPEYLGYSVVLTHKKYGKITTRGVLYFKLTNQDVLKVKIGMPPENIEASLKAVKRWVNSFRYETRERLDKMAREGFIPE